MGKQAMDIDFSDFDKGFKKLVEKDIPPELGKGMFATLNELLRDAKVEPPQAPKEVGDLWGSAQVNKVEIGKGKIEGQAGFNIEYAARWHEISAEEDSRINWTRDKGARSPGRKYLEKKMVMYKEKYMEIIGMFVAKLLG